MTTTTTPSSFPPRDDDRDRAQPPPPPLKMRNLHHSSSTRHSSSGHEPASVRLRGGGGAKKDGTDPTPPIATSSSPELEVEDNKEKFILIEGETSSSWLFPSAPHSRVIVIAIAAIAVFAITAAMLFRSYWKPRTTSSSTSGGGGGGASASAESLASPAAERTIDFVATASAAATADRRTVAPSTALVALADGAAAPHRSSLTIVRTRSDSNADGSFVLSEDAGGTISASSDSGTHEIVMYRYPSYEIAHSEPNVTELVIDFLPPGEYTCFVFAIGSAVDAKLTLRKKRTGTTTMRRPPSRIHRSTLETIAKTREARIAGIVESLAAPGSRLVFAASSAPSQMWPRPLYMRVETLSAAVPDETTELFIVVPSYGFVVSGAVEHLGPVIHESANFAIYRCVARPFTTAARSDFAFLQRRRRDTAASSSTSRDDHNTINVQVVYPDMAISATHLSPQTRVFMFAPE